MKFCEKHLWSWLKAINYVGPSDLGSRYRHATPRVGTLGYKYGDPLGLDRNVAILIGHHYAMSH